jgi:archaellum component FlaC
MAKNGGKVMVLMLGGKGSCKPSDMDDDSDEMEEEDDDMPMKKAKGGMVKKAKGGMVNKPA